MHFSLYEAFWYSLRNVSLTHRFSLPPIVFLSYCLLSGIQGGVSAGQLEKVCQDAGIGGEQAAIILAVWNEYSQRIVISVLGKTVSANRLIDMDWNFGVTAASSDCDSIGKPFLQLRLTIDEGSGTRDRFVELSLDQFYQFLTAMENCKSYMDLMSSASS